MLDDDDIARVRDVSSPEQLNDVYHHFLLYYGREVPKMQVAEKIKRKQEKKEQKKREKEELRRQRNEDNEDGEQVIRRIRFPVEKVICNFRACHIFKRASLPMLLCADNFLRILPQEPEPEEEEKDDDDEDLTQAAKTATRRDPYSHCQVSKSSISRYYAVPHCPDTKLLVMNYFCAAIPF